jgi:transposase
MLSYQFRLYPNKEEERKLLFAKEQRRLVYNRLLEECNAGTKGRNQLSMFPTRLKIEWPELNEVYSKCLQPEADRLLHNLRGIDERAE